MPNYRRACSPGGTYFFTVVTHQLVGYGASITLNNPALCPPLHPPYCSTCPCPETGFFWKNPVS